MKLCKASLCLVMLLLPQAVLAARNPIKCGLVLVHRAERRHTLGYRVVRLPSACEGGITVQQPYQTVNGEYGAEVWRWSERLTWAVDTKEQPINDPPIGKGKAPRPKRTLTREWWKGSQRFTVTEVLP